MSGALNRMMSDFRRRQRVRHAMFDHLGIDITDEQAPAHFDELRDTLVACNRCCCTDTCARWIAQGHPGTPHFCRARTAFQKLELASAARPRLREAAE